LLAHREMGNARSRRDKTKAGRRIINSPKLGPREPKILGQLWAHSHSRFAEKHFHTSYTVVPSWLSGT
jgi:hypothetical protein